MKSLMLVSLLVTVATSYAPLELNLIENQETVNSDPSLSNVITFSIRTIEKTLEQHKKEFDQKFTALENTCRESRNIVIDIERLPENLDSKIEKIREKLVDELLRFTDTAQKNVVNKIVEALDRGLAQVDLKVAELNGRISDLHSNISYLASRDEMANLQSHLTERTEEAADRVLTVLSELPTVVDVEVIHSAVSKILQDISAKLQESSPCGNSEEEVGNILHNLNATEAYLKDVSEILQDPSHSLTCSSSCDAIDQQLQTLQETLQINKKAINGFNESLAVVKEFLSARLDGLEMTAQTITEVIRTQEELTEIASTTTPMPTTYEPPPPCQDSNFVGAGRSLDICNAAVRFKKCHLIFVAFHCCRSCMNAGLISSAPNFRGPREIPVLLALNSIKPMNMHVIG